MKNQLIGHSSAGGYAIIYHDNQSNVYCAPCATEEGLVESNGFIHWEGSSFHCEGCNTELESEYGDPEEEEQ